MAWHLKQIHPDVIKIVYTKQGEYAAKKGRKVSIDYTINKMIMDAYGDKKEQEKK